MHTRMQGLTELKKTKCIYRIEYRLIQDARWYKSTSRFLQSHASPPPVPCFSHTHHVARNHTFGTHRYAFPRGKSINLSSCMLTLFDRDVNM